MLLPTLISKLLNRDIYELLTYKGVTSAFQTKRKLYSIMMIATLLLTISLNIIGVYFKKIPDFTSLMALSPYFSNEWVGYLYAFIVPMLLTGVIYLEMKFYYGVISVLLPDNIVGYLIIAIF